MKNLLVCDVDETLIDWGCHFNGIGMVPYDERFYAYELITWAIENGFDVALFSTANKQHVINVAMNIFKGIYFSHLFGIEKVQCLDGGKVKNLKIFEEYGYSVENCILIDDKPRNARLQPDNYLYVKPSWYYRQKDIFDNGLVKIKSKLVHLLNEQKNENVPFSETINKKGWNNVL